MEKLEGQQCMVCHEPALTLEEIEQDVPFFGKVAIFSMHCDACEFKKSDVEALEQKDPARFTLEISSIDDLNIRIVKSSEATINWKDLKIKIESTVNSEGFVSNVERLLNDILQTLEDNKEIEEDNAKRKKYRNLIDEVLDIKEGKKKTTLIIEDMSGNSAIISEKAVKEALKGKRKN